jgi:hypothetical protein
MQVISASGKIKWFKIVGGIIAFVCVLSGYLLIQNGAPAYTMIVVFIVADVVNRIIQLALMKFIIGFNSWRYVREAYLRPFVIALIMSICLYIYSLLALDNMVLKLLAIMGCLGITSTLVFTIGMTSGEKNKLLAFVKNKIR